MTRINHSVTHLLKSWMGNKIMIGSLSRDPGLVSDEMTKTEKGKKWVKIITYLVLPGGWMGFCVLDKIQK